MAQSALTREHPAVEPAFAGLHHQHQRTPSAAIAVCAVMAIAQPRPLVIVMVRDNARRMIRTGRRNGMAKDQPAGLN
jgi:hypothetical protein